jgi:hypothetical protein
LLGPMPGRKYLGHMCCQWQNPPLSTLVGDTDLEQSDSGGELTIVGMARPGPGDVGLTTKGSEGGGVAVSGREVESCDWAMTTGTDGGWVGRIADDGRGGCKTTVWAWLVSSLKDKTWGGDSY